MFKFIRRLFGKKESVVSRLCRGSAEIDRMSAEIRTVVGLVMSYATNYYSATSPEEYLTVDLGPDWYIVSDWGKVTLRYQWWIYTAIMVYEKGKFVQPPLEAVKPLHVNLEIFLTQAMKQVPGLESYLGPRLMV